MRKYNEGEFCTLPHVIELMQVDYKDLLQYFRTEKEIDVLINPFVNALLNGVMEQLEGQIASAKVAMGKNRQKIQIYGAVLSLYVNRLVTLVNKKGKRKATLFLMNFPPFILVIWTTCSLLPEVIK